RSDRGPPRLPLVEPGRRARRDGLRPLRQRAVVGRPSLWPDRADDRGNYTPGLILLAERFPAATRGRATGFFLAATSMGAAASLFLSAVVRHRWAGRPPLAASCLAPAVPAVIAAWAVWHMPARIYPRAAGHGFVAGVLRNPGAMLLMAAYTFHSWELLGMWA